MLQMRSVKTNFQFFQEDKILTVKLSEDNFSDSGNSSDMQSVNEATRDNNSWQVQVHSEVSRETNKTRGVS